MSNSTIRTSRTDDSCGAVSKIVPSATRAASSTGYPKTPVEIAGNAIDARSCLSASVRALR